MNRSNGLTGVITFKPELFHWATSGQVKKEFETQYIPSEPKWRQKPPAD